MDQYLKYCKHCWVIALVSGISCNFVPYPWYVILQTIAMISALGYILWITEKI